MIGGRNVKFRTVKGDFESSKLVYGERTGDAPLVGNLWTFTILEAQRTGTRYRIESHYKPKNAFAKLLSPIFRMATTRATRQVFQDFKALCESDYLREETATEQVADQPQA